MLKSYHIPLFFFNLTIRHEFLIYVIKDYFIFFKLKLFFYYLITMTKMKIMKPKKDNYYTSADLIIVRVGAGPNQWNE